jgi:hypothetical protein
MALSWLERFAESIADRASDAVKNDVMKGAETLGSRPTSSQRARWVKGAMERVVALVDEETQIQIMVSICPHKYPNKRVEKLRKQYPQLGNIDKLQDLMYHDTSYGGTALLRLSSEKGNHSLHHQSSL